MCKTFHCFYQKDSALFTFLKEPPCLDPHVYRHSPASHEQIPGKVNCNLCFQRLSFQAQLPPISLFILNYLFCLVLFVAEDLNSADPKMRPDHASILLYICSFISLINQALPSEMENSGAGFTWDSRGYVFYCPCMGELIFRCGQKRRLFKISTKIIFSWY